MKPNGEGSSERGRQIRQASIALTIPMVMAAGPLVGWGLAWAARRWLNAPDWFTPIAIGLGLAAGIRQTIQLIRRLEP
jgi:F0F1-type ATP synthase assembly protein I